MVSVGITVGVLADVYEISSSDLVKEIFRRQRTSENFCAPPLPVTAHLYGFWRCKFEPWYALSWILRRRIVVYSL